MDMSFREHAPEEKEATPLWVTYVPPTSGTRCLRGKRKTGNDKPEGGKEDKKKPMFNPCLGVLEVPEYYTAHNIKWMANMPLYNVNSHGKKRDWYMKTNLNGTVLHQGCNQTYSHFFFFLFHASLPYQ